MSLETNKNKVTLHIIKEGEVWIVGVYTNLLISDLISMAISHFNDPNECDSLIPRYKFISVSQNKTLNFQSTVGEEDLKINGKHIRVRLHSLSLDHKH